MTTTNTPRYAVDWDGSGTFTPLTSDDLTIQNGSVSFSHSYDTPSGPSGYNAVVQISDGNGGVTDYTSNVVINAVTPTATFGPSAPAGYSGTIDATAPFVFGASDPSVSDTQAGFTYYVSLDGGAYTSSSSPTYLLPSGISTGQHTVTGYVQDSNGQSSTPVTWTGTVQAAGVTFLNDGTGQVQINWTGSGGAVTLNANQSYQIAGTAPGLSVTLLTSGATYQLDTNGSIDSITSASGVSDVSLTVDTGVNYTSASMWVGDGHIGTVSLPGGGSTVSLYARGNLANLTGSSSTGTQTGLSALDLVFANLTGSITGLDTIGNLNVSGWLGTNASEEVEAGNGIGVLNAFGVGATVLADLRGDAGDQAMTVSVDDGGVSGSIEAGTVSNATIKGNVKALLIALLTGTAKIDGTDGALIVDASDANSVIDVGDVSTLEFDGTKPFSVKKVQAGTIGSLSATKDVTVTGAITAKAITQIDVGGNLTAGSITTTGVMDTVKVTGNLTLTSRLKATTVNALDVGGNLTGRIEQTDGGEGGTFKVGGNFAGGVSADQGSISKIVVGGKFTAGAATFLVNAKQGVGVIEAHDTIGAEVGGDPTGLIEAGNIGEIRSDLGGILLKSITTTDGGIDLIDARNGKLRGKVTVTGGNLLEVKAETMAANLTVNAKGEEGGNIGDITSEYAIPKSVTITAALGIHQIKVNDGGRRWPSP